MSIISPFINFQLAFWHSLFANPTWPLLPFFCLLAVRLRTKKPHMPKTIAVDQVVEVKRVYVNSMIYWKKHLLIRTIYLLFSILVPTLGVFMLLATIGIWGPKTLARYDHILD